MNNGKKKEDECIYSNIREVCAKQDGIYARMAQYGHGERQTRRKDPVGMFSHERYLRCVRLNTSFGVSAQS